MSLSQLRYFVAVAEEKNVGRALESIDEAASATRRAAKTAGLV